MTVEYFTSNTLKTDTDVFNQLNEMNTIKARKSIKRKNCYILKKKSNIIILSTKNEEYLEFGGPIFKSRNHGIDKLSYYLENILETPIIDKTKLKGKYDIDLDWQFEAPKTLNNELKKYGLKLKKARFKRKMEVLEIFIS